MAQFDGAFSAISILVAGVGLVSAFATVFLYLLEGRRRRKVLNYAITSDKPVSVQESKGTTTALPGDESSHKAYRIVLKLWNSGNVPVLPSDFVTPIELNFGETTQVLEAKILETEPNNILIATPNVSQPILKLDGGSVILGPVLLEKKSSITLEVLLNKFSDSLNVYARIAGVPQINQSSAA
ncbi:MAG TPA: hypothetical protein VJ761_07330 [Ktedonobacteraceae bacterium]|nr:hypothetical protein [Ktedonobacteraceae bacterium]